MSLTVNLTLRGLCAFLPAEPIDHDRLAHDQQELTLLRVLLPDAREGGSVGPHQICSHDPMVTFDPPSGPSEPWDVAGDVIEILESDLTAPTGGVSVLPNFGSLTRLRLAAPGTSQLQPELDAPLVATLALAAGSVRGIEIGRPATFRESADGPSTYGGQFAAAVQVLVPLAGTKAVLRATPIAGGEVRTVELQPKKGKSSVDITIQNLCKPSESPHGLEPDNDFAIYYRFFPDYPGPFFVPFPLHGNPHAGDEVVAEAVHPGGCFPTSF